MKTNIYLYNLLCLLFAGMVVLPCRAEETEEEPIEEPTVYLPLFGEYETTYNVFTSCGIADIENTDSLYYTGEQVIDGKTYKTFSDYYYLRVADDNSKVYLRYHEFWGSGEWKEVLLFDLSLEVGDTFTYPYSEREFIVTGVGKKTGRRTIFLNSDTGYGVIYLKFIEGVGSSAGLFDPWGEGILLCSSKDGESTYFYYDDFRKEGERDIRDCFSYLFQEPACSFNWVDVDDASLSGDWLVYPNPFSEAFYVLHQTERIEQLRIYNEAGQLILEKEINDVEAHIDLSAPPGVYYVSIITESGKRYHKKMVKL